ncbi:uncharacterized protein EDB93DRAFT_1080411 [Suillus bovinus]|uniref:uncharacterized protein n=1 Tax=Suillus bovinus TaxID=48563 RepID=UPI001B87A941|nr:uncharacterized protein EDB93DRAFT_1080411 [Suillus bovinus]KAG2155361.1 hypothetical protein EDB93DRAFT_1080411 [Suillus bovinus]
MEHAIKLFFKRSMLLRNIDTTGNSQNNKTPVDINLSMDKESSVLLVFSDANWGAYTRSYIMSINYLLDSVIFQNLELTQNLIIKRHST